MSGAGGAPGEPPGPGCGWAGLGWAGGAAPLPAGGGKAAALRKNENVPRELLAGEKLSVSLSLHFFFFNFVVVDFGVFGLEGTRRLGARREPRTWQTGGDIPAQGAGTPRPFLTLFSLFPPFLPTPLCLRLSPPSRWVGAGAVDEQRGLRARPCGPGAPGLGGSCGLPARPLCCSLRQYFNIYGR